MKSRLESYSSQNGLIALKRLIYHYADKFEHSCVLDSCEVNTGVYSGTYELLAAFDSEEVYKSTDFLKKVESIDDWLFGVLGYDLKNSFEDLSSENDVLVNTPDLLFFKPVTVLAIDKNGAIEILKGSIDESFWEISNEVEVRNIEPVSSPVNKEFYLDRISEIQELIREGEVYELNYCVPFSHRFTSFNPVSFHLDLVKSSPVPMATFVKSKNTYLSGASMERFLTRKDNTLISQPIKGTIRKGNSVEEDSKLIAQLQKSEKDKAENVMIVDLVRNDLARIGVPGSTKVPELFGIYSYLQVHQMISTVTTDIKEGVSFEDILKATFPMGSMTGAPKIAAMKEIERLEQFKRGWYSGAVGYISPSGDFDFNVVIRSVVCDTQDRVIHYFAGGAITIDSDPESEWNEVQLKIKAIKDLLEQ